MSEPFDPSRVCRLPGHCAICGGPNGCRMEGGEGFKGACWCERFVLAPAALHRLLGEAPEPRCLCESCLSGIEANPEVSWDELVRRRAKKERYSPMS